tara:strand:+ start:552 stop:827 length:276 start_codon:yes stop_codon:yes gene_type:complete
MKVLFLKSEKPEKRMKAVFDGKKTVHFGQKGASTYLEHRDTKIKRAWEARHIVREDWNNPLSAGALSKWILWNKTTLEASIKDYKKKFNMS